MASKRTERDTGRAMSQENVEVILQAIEAVNQGDVDAFVATASPDIEFEDSAFWSEPARIYRGKAELREWFNQVLLDPWEGLHCEVPEIIEAADDRVIYELVITARGKGSGVETQQRFWSVNWFAEGKTTRRKVFLDREEALEAAGLRE
jgi:ketosteroid isomerase-like protein